MEARFGIYPDPSTDWMAAPTSLSAVMRSFSAHLLDRFESAPDPWVSTVVAIAFTEPSPRAAAWMGSPHGLWEVAWNWAGDETHAFLDALAAARASEGHQERWNFLSVRLVRTQGRTGEGSTDLLDARAVPLADPADGLADRALRRLLNGLSPAPRAQV